jgi:hypothetical protein
MVCGVEQDMNQNVFDAARPWFAFAVAVFDIIAKRASPKTGRSLARKIYKIITPRQNHLVGQGHAIRNG